MSERIMFEIINCIKNSTNGVIDLAIYIAENYNIEMPYSLWLISKYR